MKKMLSLLICICMLFSMLPMGTLALADSAAKIEAAYDAARLDDGYKEIGSIFYFDADEPENSASGDWDDLLKISGVTMGKSYKIMTAYNDGSSATTVWQDVTADINADGQVTEEEAKFVAQHGSGKPIVVADDYPFSPYSADSKISYYFTERKTMDTPGYIDGVVVGKDYPMYGPNAVIYRPLNGATVTVDGQEESSGYDENYGGVDGEGGNGYFSVESNTFVAGDTKIADICYGNVKYSAFQQVNAPQRYIIDLADVFTVSNATIYKDDTLIENDVVIYNDDAEYTLEFSTSSANDNLIATRVELKFYKADGSYYTSREFSSDGELTGLFKCTFTPSTLVGLDDGSKITVTFIDNKGSRYNEHDSGLRIKASPDASIEDEVFGDLPVFAADEQRERWNALRAVNFATVNDIPLEIGKFFNLDTQLTTEDYFGRYDDNNECNGIGITVKYVSSDESVAKVYENGYIEGISEGTATITAYIMPADSTFDGKNYLSDYPDFEGNTSLILDVQIGVTVTEALPDISYKDYIIEQHDLTHIQNVFDGVAEVTESGDTITVKFTSDIYGYILLNEGCKVVFDLNGKTIDPGDSNEAICLKHYEGINLTITGEGTIKKGNHNVIYVGYQNNLYFAPAKGMHYFTLKQGENDVFSAEENTEKKSYGTIGNADDLVMTHGVYSSTYTIVFNANGGEGTMESQSAPVEHSTNLVPNVFTKEGMDFAGWALSPDGAKVYSDEGSVKDLANEGESITLYAAWIISNKDYEIFTDVLTDVQNTFEGVAEVTKDDTTSVVTIKLTSDIYGRLHFNDNSGKFVLDLNGKTIDPVIRDESICLNHGFGGEVTITGEGTIKKGKNNTIYASRGTLYFAVAEGYDYFTLKAGASNVFDAKNYETKEKNGYFKVSGDIVMTQGTSLGCYTVTFDANGGSGTMADQVIDVGEATELSANTFTYSGKVFEGWATSTDGEVVYTDKEVVTDITTKGQEITLYAVWQDEVIPNPEGPDISYKDYIIEQHDLTHIQSVFDGVAEVTESGDTITVKFTSDIYGYIMFNGNGCEVVFDLNGKTIDPGDSNEAICLEHEVGVNLTITGEGTIKKGYYNVIYVGIDNNLYFAPAEGMHYFTLKQGENDIFSVEENTEKKSSETIENADDLVMTQGVYSSTYTIVFNANGGSGTMANQTVNAGEATALNANKFTKSGMKFTGWATSADGEVVYANKASVTLDEDITLYAVWKKKTTSGGGGGGSVSRPVVKDEDKTETEKEEVKDVETKEPENVGTTGEGAATSGSTTPASKTAFTDVSADAWYSDEVAYVVENGLMNGISEDEFGPDVLLTRAMLVTMLYRNAGEPAVNRSIPFGDLDMDYYYVNAVIWAQQNGIVTGITETEFGPNANITREQIATIMFRYAQYKGMNAITMEENLHFEDADEIFEYAITSMNWAVGTGLMNGKTETTINPKDNATRAEIATILQRFMENNK